MSIEALNWALHRTAGMIPSPTARHIMLILGNYADEHGRCCPSREYIAQMAGLSVRCVQNQLNWLVDNNIIERTAVRSDSGQFQYNIYTLTAFLDYDRCSRDTVTPGGQQPSARGAHGPCARGAHYTKEEEKNKNSVPSERVAIATPKRDNDPVSRRIWTDGLDLILSTGQLSESGARSLLGKLAKQFGNENLAIAIAITQAKNPVVPHEFLIATLNSKGGRNARSNSAAAAEWAEAARRLSE